MNFKVNYFKCRSTYQHKGMHNVASKQSLETEVFFFRLLNTLLTLKYY